MTSEKLAANKNGIFLLTSGIDIYLWVGSQVHPTVLQWIFGVPSYQQLESGKITLIHRSEQDFPLARKVINMIKSIQVLRNVSQPFVFVVKEDSDASLRFSFLNQLIEDRTENFMSYQQLLLQLKEKMTP